MKPVIIPRDKHNVSRKNISKNALKVLYRLHDSGFNAYLVGGGVRDMLLGIQPKDFDIVTNATPEEIKGLFRNCRLIGRRFRLAHVVFGRDIIEVATFRGHHDEQKSKTGSTNQDGQLLRDNVYGTIDEDAERRDFSINALYYNIADHTIIDYWSGLKAIANRSIDLIGDPETRYREDPVRMIRAVRFAVKLDMQISEAAARPIVPLASLLQNIPSARLFEESLKLLMSGHGLQTFKMLCDFNLFQQIFPTLSDEITDENSLTYRILVAGLRNTDQRLQANKRVTPAFLFAILLWYEQEKRRTELELDSGLPQYDACQIAISETLENHGNNIVIPKRFATMIREMWAMQPRLDKRGGRRAFKLLEATKFRAAYDFLLLRAEIEGGALAELAKWWTDFQFATPEVQNTMVQGLEDEDGGKRKPRNNRRRRFRKRSSRNTNSTPDSPSNTD